MLLPELSFNYNLDFNSRTQVLATAKALEDTGVAAYMVPDDYYRILIIYYWLEKVSVEARHASAIKPLNPNSADFAGNDVIDMMTGLDVSKNPSEVISIAGAFILLLLLPQNIYLNIMN
jgi:hypothetical protein